MVYRAVPITQRDGSNLANSNCRMASIATGIDFHTLGGQTSSGKAMRARQPDQSGGTDSGDAVKAWSSYEQSLKVCDGQSWADALGNLRAGRLVHLDVWHGTVGGPCLSGSGGYGHTMAVAPETRSNNGTPQWLVADPWCSPPKWSWTDESKLRAGAEKWGSQVFTAATAGKDPREIPEHALILLMVAAALILTRRYHPGAEAPEDLPDTGGAGGRILFTVTRSQSGSGGGGGVDMGIYFNPARWKATKVIEVFTSPDWSDKVTEIQKGSEFTSLGPKAVTDSDGKDTSARAVLVSTGGLVPGTTDPAVKAVLWAKGADFPPESIATSQDWDDSIWRLSQIPTGRYPAPPCPDCPDCPECPPDSDEECDKRIAEALEFRDTEWAEAIQSGNAWPTRD